MTDSASQQDARADPLLPARILYRGLYRQSRLPSCRLNLKDIPKLYQELQEPAREAVDQQLESYTPRPDTDPNERDEAVTRAREVSGLAVTVIGRHGQQLVAQSVDELSIEKLPEGLSLVVFDSGVAFQKHYGQLPLNRFKLTLDFSEPPGYKLGSYKPMDEPTPNTSSLEIIGPNQTWVGGVHDRVMSFLRARGTRRGLLHNHVVYVWFTWLVSVPLTFWLVYRIDVWLGAFLAQLPGVIRAGVYVYAFVGIFLLFRLLTELIRWTFPLVELEGSRSKAIRRTISVVLLGVASALVAALIL